MDTLLFVMSAFSFSVTSFIHCIRKDNDFPSVILYYKKPGRKKVIDMLAPDYTDIS